MSRKKNPFPLILWKKCDLIIDTEWGDLKYEAWCHKMIDSLREVYPRCYVAFNRKGTLCCVKKK